MSQSFFPSACFPSAIPTYSTVFCDVDYFIRTLSICRSGMLPAGSIPFDIRKRRPRYFGFYRKRADPLEVSFRLRCALCLCDCARAWRLLPRASGRRCRPALQWPKNERDAPPPSCISRALPVTFAYACARAFALGLFRNRHSLKGGAPPSLARQSRSGMYIASMRPTNPGWLAQSQSESWNV